LADPHFFKMKMAYVSDENDDDDAYVVYLHVYGERGWGGGGERSERHAHDLGVLLCHAWYARATRFRPKCEMEVNIQVCGHRGEPTWYARKLNSRLFENLARLMPKMHVLDMGRESSNAPPSLALPHIIIVDPPDHSSRPRFLTS
jgi:hypothetical protein